MSKIKLPEVKNIINETKPKFQVNINELKTSNDKFAFSFALFDRKHELFNLGNNIGQSEAISGNWFIALLDCLKDVSEKSIAELRKDIHKLHPVDWASKNINARCPEGHEQLEYWQFRLNKSSGRVIGAKIDNCFYIVWLDPYHNLINSQGYGKAEYYKDPLTPYEQSLFECEELKKQCEKKNEYIAELEQLLYPNE